MNDSVLSLYIFQHSILFFVSFTDPFTGIVFVVDERILFGAFGVGRPTGDIPVGIDPIFGTGCNGHVGSSARISLGLGR